MHVAEINWSTGSRNLVGFSLSFSLENGYRTSLPHRVTKIGLNEKFITSSSSLNIDRTNVKTSKHIRSKLILEYLNQILNFSFWNIHTYRGKRGKIYIYIIRKINVYNINARVSRRKFISARFFVQFYMAGLPFITEEKTSVAKSHLFIPDHHRSHFEQDRGCARFDSVSLMSSRNEMGYPSSFYSAHRSYTHVLMHSSTRISW